MTAISSWPWFVIGAALLLIISWRTLGLLAFLVVRSRRTRPGEFEMYSKAVPPFNVRGLVQIIITVAVLGSALFVILSNGYDDAEQKWAFASVGTILGYWLKN